MRTSSLPPRMLVAVLTMLASVLAPDAIRASSLDQKSGQTVADGDANDVNTIVDLPLTKGQDLELRDRVEALSAEIDVLREQLEAMASALTRSRAALVAHRLPEAIAYAGHSVPLDRWDVLERLEREFYLALGSPAQVILWLKRSARYFPYIETELKLAGLPDDLKYVAVVESALLPRARSWAEASGIWQFMAATARDYGLRVTPVWDERRDPARSTAAALAYLRDLHASFQDWPLALAAYNAGPGRVRAAMRQQGVSTYYQLSLASETERYFFRILAAKLILEDPARYGFEVPPEERYSPHATEAVTLRATGDVAVAEIAEAASSFYRQIKALNPAIMTATLPAGTYEIRVPEGQRATFQAALPALQRRIAARAVQHVQYRVRPGDTLGGIARQHGVTVEDLRKWNPAARQPHIRPGQVLSIERRGAPAP